ncbi:hypothetical protein I3842_01G086800 [Carya illinoinensis]|uniref:Reverse transcriptase zinc-binding domain-containing protein n=1 Tax=Carya illinoinensis TaxID=32201 RepID=A0A922FY00_CARIL|nr:hypothetical protein I3842_01G086800 [Carya illinoinensis]
MDWCFMCKRNGESTDHLLLHCNVAKALWDDIFVAWVMPKRLVDLLSCWNGVRGNRQVAEVWKMVPLCLTWFIWNERNGYCFENRECSFLFVLVGGGRGGGVIGVLFYQSLLLWAKAIVLEGANLNDLYSSFFATML